MAREPVAEMLAHAKKHHYALGYFESWDLASLEAAIDAAEKTRSPIIIGFNGEFLCRGGRAETARLEWYAALGQAAAESAKVPCAVMFNECAVDEAVVRAAALGFHLVMLADEAAPYEDLKGRIAAIEPMAHAFGAAIEAELGTLPCGVGDGHAAAALTDPDLAAQFVRDTKVDLLAVSVGNTHIRLQGEGDLDLPHLQAIRDKLAVPLVLHGGTGISATSIARAIEIGVVKVNYGTYLKQRCLAAMQQALATDQRNPHERLGFGGESDLLVVTRRAVREAILERIGVLGCCGKG